jgi:acyl dehydratase
LEKRYLEDLSEGELLQCQTVKFSHDSIVDFARNFDPQPFHTDEHFANGSIFGGLIASSLHTLSACTRVVVEAQNNVAILSGVGMDEVKMFNPVRPGDILSVKAWWSNIKQSQSKPDRGFASIKCKVLNQDSQLVIAYGYQYLVACKCYYGIA